MNRLDIPTAAVFRPLLQPARFKGAHGGRGSGKSHFYAELLVEECFVQPGTRAVCIRETQRSLKESSKQIVEAKIQKLGLGASFGVRHDRIITPGAGSILFQGMSDHTAESIKSLEGCRIAWVDEGQSLTERSLSLLRPTIRMPGSQLWFGWNPTRKTDAVDKFLRDPRLDDKIVVQANWRDNPWFNDVLEAERQRELLLNPERYPHTWEGDYAAAFEGAYFAGLLTKAKLEGRIGRVAADPLLPVRAYWDIGGSGANADANAIWIVQFVGESILVLDYIETRGQVLGYTVGELRSRGWDKAVCVLPHDGVNENNVTGKRYVDHLKDAGFEVETVPNMGRGAAAMRIEAVRRIFPKCWFNEATTEAGRSALGFYHERRDSMRDVGLGPMHNWASHGADAFGLMAVDYRPPSQTVEQNRDIVYPAEWNSVA